MDFYDYYDTTIVLACVGAVILTLLVLTIAYFVYYRGRDLDEEEEAL